MTIQHKLKKKGARWRDYPGKDKFNHPVNKYDWRLLNQAKTKILISKGNYAHVLKRFRQIEFFKRS